MAAGGAPIVTAPADLQARGPRLSHTTNADDYDVCGTFGCTLPNNHAGLHDCVVGSGRRQRMPARAAAIGGAWACPACTLDNEGAADACAACGAKRPACHAAGGGGDGDGDDAELAIVRRVVEREKRPGSGFSFQIASVHMAPCVLWCAVRYHAAPRLAVQKAIDLGGDTDTTATMVGAIVGALHGTGWCARWAAGLENGPRGRDYALGLADQLAAMQLTTECSD